MAMSPKTENGIRTYICKRCGRETTENVYKWRKKAQKDKRICPHCLNSRAAAIAARQEMRHNMPYGLYR